MPSNKRIAVIGAGAAGLMAAGTALRAGAEVHIYEHKPKPGRKLLITGKGRCNVTNHTSVAEFMQEVVSNPKFLYSAVSSFAPSDTEVLFEELGVRLKIERGNRVFPESDKSSDILNALLKYCRGAVMHHEKVLKIDTDGSAVTGITAECGYRPYDAVILATGGASYPLTGSDGSGYRLATDLGHTMTELCPSLVPLEIHGSECKQMQGLSLRNIAITVYDRGGKKLYDDFGELLFTHFGVSGPVILSASSHLREKNIDGYRLSIDMKPALDDRTLDNRLLSDFEKYSNRNFDNALVSLLPQKMIPIFINKCGISPAKKVNSISRTERATILHTLKCFEMMISGRRPIDEAIITRGGIVTKEIDPKTMQSKLVNGLFVSGEMIDVDAYTGGYNLQIAFSTGYCAGKSAVL